MKYESASKCTDEVQHLLEEVWSNSIAEWTAPMTLDMDVYLCIGRCNLYSYKVRNLGSGMQWTRGRVRMNAMACLQQNRLCSSHKVQIARIRHSQLIFWAYNNLRRKHEKIIPFIYMKNKLKRLLQWPLSVFLSLLLSLPFFFSFLSSFYLFDWFVYFSLLLFLFDLLSIL